MTEVLPHTAALVSKMLRVERKDVRAYAVEFEFNGRPHRTVWTTYSSEAEGWLGAIRETGWSTSGRPLPRE